MTREELLTPKELATRLETSPRRVRSWLRKMHPRPAEEKRRRWHIPNEWAKEVEAVPPPRRMVKERKVAAVVVSQNRTCLRDTRWAMSLPWGTRPPRACALGRSTPSFRLPQCCCLAARSPGGRTRTRPKLHVLTLKTRWSLN